MISPISPLTLTPPPLPPPRLPMTPPRPQARAPALRTLPARRPSCLTPAPLRRLPAEKAKPRKKRQKERRFATPTCPREQAACSPASRTAVLEIIEKSERRRRRTVTLILVVLPLVLVLPVPGRCGVFLRNDLGATPCRQELRHGALRLRPPRTTWARRWTAAPASWRYLGWPGL